MELSEEFRKKSKEALKKGVRFCFCPKRLSILGRDDLSVFPFNILFMVHKDKSDGSSFLRSAIYNPDFSTFFQDDEKISMKYRNNYGGNSYVLIMFDIANFSYQGDKFLNDICVGSVTERIVTDSNGVKQGWNTFFFQLTMLGLSEGEGCEVELLSAV